jgi:hypothetical protein
VSFDSLSFGETVVIIVVAIELLIVVTALVALVVMRGRAIRREENVDRGRSELAEVMPDLTSDQTGEAMKRATTIVERVGKDNARRLITELAEFVTIEHATTLAELFVASGLAEASQITAKSRPWERLRVIREARALNDPGGVLTTLLKDENYDVQIATFEALCALGRAPEALGVLEQIVVQGRLVRTRITDALAATDPLPVQELARLAQSTTRDVRQVSIGAIGRAGARQALDVVISGVTDEDVEVRIESLRALAEMEDPRGLPAALSALNDEFWEVRSAAVGTSAALGGEGAVMPIAVLLDDPAEWVRHNASLALGRCGPAGTSALRAAAARGNESASSSLAEHRMAREGT